MVLSVADCTNAIRNHTEGLAAAAEGNLEKRIEHCPEWSMAELVWHLINVHSNWNFIASTLPIEQPEDRPVVEHPGDEALIPRLLSGMETLIATLEAADQAAPCWTWGQEQNVWFITRHQVQEAAVHHWDAVNAAGGTWKMDPLVAIDAVEEFLTHSVANPRWPMPDAEPLGTTLTICACMSDDIGAIPLWTIADGTIPGTLTLTIQEKTPDPAKRNLGSGGHVDPEQMLLWLYRRTVNTVLVDLPGDDDPVIKRFRALTFTD